MSLAFHSTKESLYLQVYDHYKNLIMEHRIPAGSRMPSLRKCATELKLSRTTIENAYLQLAADGYIVARAQSGYYVTSIADQKPVSTASWHADLPPVQYDFASNGVDRESFRFDLWQRYIKSALRQSDRLLSYGEPQGEADLRQVLADYIRQRRNVNCSADDIVIGAGVQSLLNLLCPLIRDRKSVSFPNASFVQGSTIFAGYGFEVQYRNKDCDVIYVSPAHMTKWGEVMPVSRRMELVHYAAQKGSLIIEDDFENEFVNFQRPTPSLFNLAGGHGVVYIGSFSRLLLPSIRLSFMVLPPDLSRKYAAVADRYSQTASKAEQIALTQFIRDGHLASQVRKSRKIHLAKAEKLAESIHKVFGDTVNVKIGEAGFMVQIIFSNGTDVKKVAKAARKEGLTFREAEGHTLLLTCAGVESDKYEEAMQILAKCVIIDNMK